MHICKSGISAICASAVYVADVANMHVPVAGFSACDVLHKQAFLHRTHTHSKRSFFIASGDRSLYQKGCRMARHPQKSLYKLIYAVFINTVRNILVNLVLIDKCDCTNDRTIAMYQRSGKAQNQNLWPLTSQYRRRGFRYP